MVDPTPKFADAGTAAAPDSLLTGHFPPVTEKVTIVSGAGVLARGAVLGKITASGKHTLSVAAAEDGSEDVDAILAHDVDATSADRPATVYITGSFNERKLVFGTGHTAANTKDALRAKSIFLRSSVA